VNKIILHSNIYDGLLMAAESEWAVPYPDVARWVSAAGSSCGRQQQVGRGPGRRRCRPESAYGRPRISVNVF
jgi:hypothetical protein